MGSLPGDRWVRLSGAGVPGQVEECPDCCFLRRLPWVCPRSCGWADGCLRLPARAAFEVLPRWPGPGVGRDAWTGVHRTLGRDFLGFRCHSELGRSLWLSCGAVLGCCVLPLPGFPIVATAVVPCPWSGVPSSSLLSGHGVLISENPGVEMGGSRAVLGSGACLFCQGRRRCSSGDPEPGGFTAAGAGQHRLPCSGLLLLFAPRAALSLPVSSGWEAVACDSRPAHLDSAGSVLVRGVCPPSFWVWSVPGVWAPRGALWGESGPATSALGPLGPAAWCPGWLMRAQGFLRRPRVPGPWGLL